ALPLRRAPGKHLLQPHSTRSNPMLVQQTTRLAPAHGPTFVITIPTRRQNLSVACALLHSAENVLDMSPAARSLSARCAEISVDRIQRSRLKLRAQNFRVRVLGSPTSREQSSIHSNTRLR